MSQRGKELASTFSPAEIEAPLYEKWISAGYFTADANSTKEPFSIVLPPPKLARDAPVVHVIDPIKVAWR